MQKKILHEEIKKQLVKLQHSEGQKLPSVRKMAAKLDVSIGSIVKAYAKLEKEGLIKSYPNKGFYWGKLPPFADIKKIPETSTLESKFQNDLETGFLKRFSTLPSLKELAIHYKTSLYHLRNFLKTKTSQGILQKSGVRYYFSEEKKVSQGNFILFVHRSDSKGHFFIDSEREQEVFRIVTQVAQEKKISLHYVGYYEAEDKLIGKNGEEVTPGTSTWCIGAFLSTWLISNPAILFSHFSKSKYPISVWWENSKEALLKFTRVREKWAYFDVAFNKNAGFIVGEHLKKKGISKINYLSPFHDSDWSKKREDGLKQAGLEVNPLVDTKIFSPFDLTQKAQKKGIPANDYLKRAITGLLSQAKDVPFVCANDWTAAVLIELYEERNEKIPYIIGFDNTSESYRYGFDSFAFNVEAMVTEALYHIISPTTYAILRKQIQTPLGAVIVKE